MLSKNLLRLPLSLIRASYVVVSIHISHNTKAKYLTKGFVWKRTTPAFHASQVVKSFQVKWYLDLALGLPSERSHFVRFQLAQLGNFSSSVLVESSGQ